MDTSKQIASFYEERGTILKDIHHFLQLVLRLLNDVKEKEILVHYHQLDNLGFLIESLCLIHGLYGYPKEGGKNNDMDKNAIRKKLQKITHQGKTLGDFRDMNIERFGNLTGGNAVLESQPREPAYLFLELVRGIFYFNLTKAASVGKSYLETLPDENRLKPRVWAEHTENPEIFGVSIGVRKFVRPLFIFIKLVQLRIISSRNTQTSFQLSETKAFEALRRGSFQSKYDQKKEPCPSCRVAFSVLEPSLENRRPPSFVPFGNCAEFDIIRTGNLDSILRQILNDWNIFQEACKKRFQAFIKYLSSCEAVSEQNSLQTYIDIQINNSKILQYVVGETGLDYELKVLDWGKANEPNNKKRKRSRVP